MDWLQLILIAAILGLLHFVARLERERLQAPDYVRRCGAAIGREALQIDPNTEVIGYYDGNEIRASVAYLGIRYRFECVVPPSYRRQLSAGELYVEPGLLYVTE
jgi:hypothetical protein